MPDRTDRLLSWIGRLLLVLALAMGLTALLTWPTQTAGAPETGTAIVVPPPGSRVYTDVSDDIDASNAAVTDFWRRFALNALLAPLLDDATPPRWTDVAIEFFCGASTQVRVNGQPLVTGDLVPAGPFSIRWDMDHCEPWSGAFALAGGVNLQVSHDPGGLKVVVVPDRLRLYGPNSLSHLSETFIATLSLTPSPFDR